MNFSRFVAILKNVTLNKIILYVFNENKQDEHVEEDDYYFVGPDDYYDQNTTVNELTGSANFIPISLRNGSAAVFNISNSIFQHQPYFHNTAQNYSHQLPADATSEYQQHVASSGKHKVLSYTIGAYMENLGYFISLLYIIRLYDYFAKSKKLTLQKNNLASFCVSLIVTNVLTIVDLFYQIPNFLIIITCTEFTTTVLLFTMAVDTCVNLVRNRTKRRLRVDSQFGKFIVHTFCGWIIAEAIAYFLIYINMCSVLIFIDIKLLMHIIVLGLFFISVYYIKPYQTRAHDVRVLQNFSLFGRTLIITFVFSLVRCVYAMVYYFAGKNQNFEQAHDLINAYSGVFVYYCINYKRPPKPRHERPATTHA